MTDNYVLDACALIAFLNDETGAEKIEELLLQAEKTLCRLFINKVNLLEIYYGVYRECGETEAEAVMNIIHDLSIDIVDTLSDDTFKTSGRLKATYKISLADSIALAEAITRDAKLVTTDHHEFDSIDQKNELSFYWIR